MNHLEFELAILGRNETVEYENIIYSDCAFIKLHVDNVDLIKATKNKKGLIVWNELKKTKTDSGKFLLMTCMCGVTDDADFELVNVVKTNISVKWEFNDESNFNWEFERKKYDNQLAKLESEINNLEVNLEPLNVILPEK